MNRHDPSNQKTEQRIKDLADIMDKPITELLTPLEITETAEMNIQPEDQVYLFTWNPNDRKISPHDHNMKWKLWFLSI